MNNQNNIQSLLEQTDIYLIDQIMKGRYKTADTILDAGCGTGRNLHWFIQNKFNMFATDISQEAISQLRQKYPELSADNFSVCLLEKTSFPDNYFDHIICSAVLHFAKNTDQFHDMIRKMVRILKPGGSLFIRMTSNIGIETKVTHIADGVYDIPDGSKRFLLTRTLLPDVMQLNNLSFLEPFKTVNVNDLRCMSTLILQKN